MENQSKPPAQNPCVCEPVDKANLVEKFAFRGKFPLRPPDCARNLHSCDTNRIKHLKQGNGGYERQTSIHVIQTKKLRAA
jgi:hypothetical protein